MKPPDEVKREFVRQWLTKAEDDLAAAQDMLRGNKPYRWIVCYHAQQAAEKYIKACLVHRGTEPPRLHDLAELLRVLASKDRALADRLHEARTLSAYAVDARYPGDAPSPTHEDAHEAVRLAAKVREAVLAALREAT
jgi:HEPN domain-containing protein